MPVKAEQPATKPKATKKKTWAPKEYVSVNSGIVGAQVVRVGEKITPKNQRQEKELLRRKIIT
jgi:hypothetical protein